MGFALFTLATLVCGCAPSISTSDAESKKTQPISVKTVAVESTELERTTSQPATVHPFYQAEIQAKVSGYVEEVKVDIGDAVQKGDVLATLSIPEMDKQKSILDAQIQRHLALEKQAQAGVELAKADVTAAEARLTQAKSEKKRVAASLAAAEAEFQRTKDLVDRQSLAQRVLDEVRKKRDSERAATDAIESSIQSAAAEVTVATARQTSAKADLNVAEENTKIARTELEELQVMIDYGVLKAPFAGVVTARSIDPGDLVQSQKSNDGHALFVVSQIQKVRVRIPVPEEDAIRINKGDEVTLSFPFYRNEPAITGSVSRLSQMLDSQTGTMLVEADFENPDGKLLPGMFGQATINLSTKVAANTLPARAVRFTEAGEAYVYVLGEDNTVTVTDVETGYDNGHTIEIVFGVNAGQTVIDAHRERFSNDQQVTVLQD